MITLSASVAEDKDALAVVSEKSRDLDERLIGKSISDLVAHLEYVSKNKIGLSVFFTVSSTSDLPVQDTTWAYSPGMAVNRYGTVFVLLLGRYGQLATARYEAGVLSEWTVR